MATKKLIIGNWKMNLTVHEASLYIHKLNKQLKNHRNVEIVVAPGMLALQSLSLQADRKKMKLATQNLYWRDDGAFTGEVSAHQLRGVVQYAIIGHSERRHIFGETNKETRAKVQAAVRHDITPILCIGETAGERANGETASTLQDQLVSGLANVTADEVAELVLAYEPVWAIGTGDSAVPTDVEKAIKLIRRQVSQLYGKSVAEKVRVLYGGSANGSNAASYLACDGVDGLLIGGASLKADEFETMVEAAFKTGDEK